MIESEELPVYRIDRFCTTPGCVSRWVGYTLVEPKPDELVLPGKCTACVDAHEAEIQRLQAGRMKIWLTVEPTAGQDQPYTSRSRR